MKVLVLGSGAREHAIVRSLLADPTVTEVHAAPGNAGVAAEVPIHPLDPTEPAAARALCQRLGAGLVVIGPEAPLVAGVADALREAGMPTVGPSQAAAALEGSKLFAKRLMAAAHVPTARSLLAGTAAEVEAALDTFGPPYVVKDDGLAGGKGVVVTGEREEAIAHARSCHEQGRVVVIEEYLAGPEVSVFLLCDGNTSIPLGLAQDAKRAYENDEGPNTGGMGAYSPLPWAPAGLTEEVIERVSKPVLAQLAARGAPFSGILYCSLALTERGPQVIEFNTRFGDPEAQVILERLACGLGHIFYAAATGDLHKAPPLHWRPEAAVGVVLAAPGYPQAPQLGGTIDGLEQAEAVPETQILHGGTGRSTGGELVSTGGRVLTVVSRGPQLAQARERAYTAAEKLRLEGGFFRRDIGAAAAAGTLHLPGAN